MRKTMHTKQLFNTAEALRRVFLPVTASSSSLRTPACRPHLQIQVSRHQRRQVGFVGGHVFKPRQYGPRDAQGGSLRDEAIQSREVRVVDHNGSLQPAESLESVLSSFDRQKYFLVQVSPPDSDEIPVCKILDKIKAREAERAKSKPVKDLSTTTKQLELGWAIDTNDLGHRMNKMKEFLEQGRRVEIIIATKKKGRKVARDEASLLVKRIRERIAQVDGAKEWKDMQGVPGGMVTIFVEGKAKK